ncbi:B3 domain-containing protein_Os12g40080-like [Aegilops tauschii subsp. strangulata]|uniref:B3 domain-containing protein_Os12g40080-like n=1 Tax=Aegilops tauschii subsp. strangulata TaxID=200361 RepID=UPI00098ADC67|nr:B3 domain-containing protein LOC_Os12g40080-like [Aegilops tauschii subsp. strangulata]
MPPPPEVALEEEAAYQTALEATLSAAGDQVCLLPPLPEPKAEPPPTEHEPKRYAWNGYVHEWVSTPPIALDCGGAHGAGCDCGDCEEWRRYFYWNHDHGDGGTNKFLLFASHDKDNLCISPEVTNQLTNLIPDSGPIKLETPDGRTYNVEFLNLDLIVLTTGWRDFVDANHIQQGDRMLFVYSGNSTFKVHIFNSPGRNKFLSSSEPPCDHHVLNEQVVPHPGHVDRPAHFGYTLLPGSFVTKAQDDKLLEWVNTIKSGFPLFVAAMDESNVSLNDCHVYIPLWLVGQLKEEVVKIVSPDGNIYAVGAKKHNDDQIVLQSGWDRFVTDQCIQQNDFLIFIIKGETRLKVLVLDPSGHKAGNSNEAGLEAPMPNKSYIVAQAGATKLTVQQEEKVKEKVRAIGSKFPVYVKVVTPYDVIEYSQLRLCMEYASACCLPLEQTPLLLELEGTDMRWPSTLRVEKYKKVRLISSFWNDLVLEARMKKGDILLIELADRSSERLRMTIRLIRKSEMQL